MTSCSRVWAIDHYLIARVEGYTTGESAHEVHNLIAIYQGLCFLSATDEFARARLPEVEAKLRRFCHSRRLPSDFTVVQREIELHAFDVDA